MTRPALPPLETCPAVPTGEFIASLRDPAATVPVFEYNPDAAGEFSMPGYASGAPTPAERDGWPIAEQPPRGAYTLWHENRGSAGEAPWFSMYAPPYASSIRFEGEGLNPTDLFSALGYRSLAAVITNPEADPKTGIAVYGAEPLYTGDGSTQDRSQAPDSLVVQGRVAAISPVTASPNQTFRTGAGWEGAATAYGIQYNPSDTEKVIWVPSRGVPDMVSGDRRPPAVGELVQMRVERVTPNAIDGQPGGVMFMSTSAYSIIFPSPDVVRW